MWKVVVCITNVCYECTYLISNKMIHTHMTLFCGFVLMMTDEVIQGRLGWIESFGWSWSSVIRFFPRWSPSNHQSRGWWICHSSPAHFQKCKSFISFLFFDGLKKMSLILGTLGNLCVLLDNYDGIPSYPITHNPIISLLSLCDILTLSRNFVVSFASLV